MSGALITGIVWALAATVTALLPMRASLNPPGATNNMLCVVSGQFSRAGSQAPWGSDAICTSPLSALSRPTRAGGSTICSSDVARASGAATVVQAPSSSAPASDKRRCRQS